MTKEIKSADQVPDAGRRKQRKMGELTNKVHEIFDRNPAWTQGMVARFIGVHPSSVSIVVRRQGIQPHSVEEREKMITDLLKDVMAAEKTVPEDVRKRAAYIIGEDG